MGMVHAKEIKPQNSANGLLQSSIGIEERKESYCVGYTLEEMTRKLLGMQN